MENSSIVNQFYEFFDTVYKKKMQQLIPHYPFKKSFYIDYKDLEMFDVELADLLLEKPDLVLESARESIKAFNIHVGSYGLFLPHLRFINVPESDKLRIEHISSSHYNKFISLKGVVTRRGDVSHRLKLAVFKCKVCNSVFKIPVDKDFVPPRKCENCKKVALQLVEEESKFIDFQRIEVQELLEFVRGGAQAARIELWLEDDLVNSVVPGDSVEVAGILRLKLPFNRSKQNYLYSHYLDVNSIKTLQKDFEEIDFTEEDIEKIKEFSKDPRLIEKIINSIAPTISGYTEVKYALALQVFGGTKGKKISGLPLRDDIHILLIGDPGIAKTRFLQSVIEIAPKKIYASGKSVSGVGLTVAVEKDELSGGGWTLKAGALVLASGGIAAIDEFDKISDEDRAALHEVMETQSISVAKAGIVARLRAKTSILAAANPRYGRFNPNKNLAEQFDIPPSLLSRFDLIFPIVDVLDPEKDAKLADFILTSHQRAIETQTLSDENIVDKNFLRKYIAYARKYVFPRLSQDAINVIKNYYVELRKKGKESGTVPITPRYLEGLIRLSEAHAKLRLSDVVEQKDAEVSVGLMDYVMKMVLTDKETGLIDVDIAATGTPSSLRNKMDIVYNVILDLFSRYTDAEEETIIRECKEKANMDEAEVRELLDKLRMGGRIYEPKPHHFRPTDRFNR